MGEDLDCEVWGGLAVALKERMQDGLAAALPTGMWSRMEVLLEDNLEDRLASSLQLALQQGLLDWPKGSATWEIS